MGLKSLNKKYLIIATIVLAFALVACGGQKEEGKAEAKPEVKADGEPKIVAVEKEIDFGEVKQGAVVERFFIIKNKGDATLNIERARGS